MPISRVYLYLGLAVAVIAIGFGVREFMAPERDAPAGRLLTPKSVGQPERIGTPAIGGPFALTDHNGKPVSDADFRGRHLLIFFGYTYCPDICPTSLSEMSAAIDLLGADGDKVQPLFITIDPERDTPEQMKMYVGHFHDRLIGLTGTPEQIAKVKEAYKVFAQKSEIDPDDADSYLMDHTANSYLMGPGGEFEAYFRNGAKPDEIAAKIREFL